MARNKDNSLTVAEAADIMGVTTQFLRIALQRGIFSFGIAQHLKGTKKYTYYINKNKLIEYVGGKSI